MTRLNLVLVIAVSVIVGTGYSLAGAPPPPDDGNGSINACVNRITGTTRILDPFSNSTKCKFWENPVS